MRFRYVIASLFILGMLIGCGGALPQESSDAVNDVPPAVNETADDPKESAVVGADEITNPQSVIEIQQATESEALEPTPISATTVETTPLAHGEIEEDESKGNCPIFQDTRSKRLAKWIEEVENSKIEKKRKKSEEDPIRCGAILTRSTHLREDLVCGVKYPVALTLVGDRIKLDGKNHSISVARRRTAVLILGEKNKIENLRMKGVKPGLGIVAYEEFATNRCKRISEIVPEAASMGIREFFLSIRSWILKFF